MTLYHVNPETGRPNICRAKTPEGCLYYNAETGVEAPHFNSKEEARAYVEGEMNKELGETKSLSKKETSEKPEKINYNLMKKFEKLEKEYEDFPKRFHKKNLRVAGNKGQTITITDEDKVVYEEYKNFLEENWDTMKQNFTKEAESIPELKNVTDEKIKDTAEEFILRKLMYERRIYRKSTSIDAGVIYLTKTMTEPKESFIEENKVKEITENLGINNLYKLSPDDIEDEYLKHRIKTLLQDYGDIYTGSRTYMDDENQELTQHFFIPTKNLGTKVLSRRTFRDKKINDALKLPSKKSSLWVDMRTAVGLSKIKTHTGTNFIENTETPHLRMKKTIEKLEKHQIRSEEIQQQREYLRDGDRKIATAYIDKKHPDKEHQKMMKETSLKKIFSHVEIDNDVDKKEYEKFEKSYHEIEHLLPKIPKEVSPSLRLRKLGKHKADGLYFPGFNTVAVDIRNTSSTIHELAHYYDFALKDNVSMSEEFSKIKRGYAEKLKVPSDRTGKYGHSYYTTNTEVHSRLFEIWAHEKLGINNQLLNPEKFTQFDYLPFQENPELKKKGFAILDKLYGKE